MKIDTIWEQIIKLEGEIFYTAKGLPFTIKVIDENTIKPYRDGNGRWNLNKKLFEKALNFDSFCNAEFNKKIIGSSYVRGILTDKRIKY